MNTAHLVAVPGLPVVPPAAHGELLGSWLLRVANIYGLGLRDLLERLRALPPDSRVLAPWYELHHGHLRCVELAAALHQPVESICAMAAPQCDRHWPAELGFCGQCLDESSLARTPPGWQRRWLHPMALACEKHRAWLDPVAISRLRQIRTAGDIERLPRKNTAWSSWERRREALLTKGALWLQALVTNPVQHPAPWGTTELDQLAKILRSLVRILMAPAAEDLVRGQLGRSLSDLPEHRQRWACQTFRVDDGVNPAMTLAAPDPLRHRQFVLGLLGYYLSLAPANRAPLDQLTKLIAREIPAGQLARWPTAAAQWVLPPLRANLPYGPSRRKSPVRPRPARAAHAPLFGV